MKPRLELQEDLADMLRELQSAGAEFVIVGGFAVAAWGHLRSTKDLDVFVRPSVDNARAVLRALVRFGAPLHDLAEQDLAEPGTVFQIGVPPRRIDIVNAVDGITFEDAIKERKLVDVSGMLVPVIGLDALLTNKRAAGRPEDRADVRELVRLHGVPQQTTSAVRKKPKRQRRPR